MRDPAPPARTVPPTLVYLHGFASGPGGNKATHCREWAAARGVPFLAPDLNLPDFEHLSISAQVEHVEVLLEALPMPPVLVGSSLGGLVAAAAVKRGLPVSTLILLAPAFGFARRRLETPRWAGYRHHRRLPVFHHAYGRWVRLGSELLEDMPHWSDDDQWELEPRPGITPDSTPAPTLIPTLILIHGRSDASVPLEETQAFARRHPDAQLHVVDDDHGLMAPTTLELLDAILERSYGKH